MLRIIQTTTFRYCPSINPRIQHLMPDSRTVSSKPDPFLGHDLKWEFDKMVKLLIQKKRLKVPHILRGLRGAEADDDSSMVFVRFFTSWWEQFENCLPGEFPNQITTVVLLLGGINLNTNRYFRKCGVITRDHIIVLEKSFTRADFSQFYFK